MTLKLWMHDSRYPLLRQRPIELRRVALELDRRLRDPLRVGGQSC